MDFSSKYYNKCDPVSILPLDSYDFKKAKDALLRVISDVLPLSETVRGKRVIIKANLVSAMKPSSGATTHPTLLAALCELLCERGAEVILGDSPGGLYNSAFVGRVYRVSGDSRFKFHGLNFKWFMNLNAVTFSALFVFWNNSCYFT